MPQVIRCECGNHMKRKSAGKMKKSVKRYMILFFQIVLAIGWLLLAVPLLKTILLDYKTNQYYIWQNTEELSVKEFNDRYVKDSFPTCVNEIKLPEEIHINKMVTKTYRTWDSTHYGVYIDSDYSLKDWEKYLDQKIPDLPLNQNICYVCKHNPEYGYGIFYDRVKKQVMLCDFRLNKVIQEQGEYGERFWGLRVIVLVVLWFLILAGILEPKIFLKKRKMMGVKHECLEDTI